jgi:uncharacterized protein involved in outer membrane biogenesis
MYRKNFIALLIVIGIVYGAYIAFNFAVCKIIETRLTHTLGLKARIGSFRLYPWRGMIAIEKFTIANPEGFSNKPIFSIKTCSAAVKLSSLTHDIIPIEEFKLHGIGINVEHNKDALNLDWLKHDVNPRAVLKNSDDADKQEQQDVPQKKLFLINRLKAKSIEVRFASASMGLKAIHFKIPDVVINDLSGPDGRPLAIDEIIYKLVCTIIDKLSSQGPANYQQEIKKFLMEQLGNYYKK